MNGHGPDLGRIGIWAGDLDGYPAAVLREAAAAIEDAGYGTLWFPETAGREAMAQAGILLAATRRIVVAAGAADIYARDAVSTAAAQRTLDEAFPGRFLLGLWESHPSLAEDVRGHRFGPRLETMRGYLDMMDAAPFGPPESPVTPRRVLAALGPDLLALARERAWGRTRWACRSSTPGPPGPCSARTRCWPSPSSSSWTRTAPPPRIWPAPTPPRSSPTAVCCCRTWGSGTSTPSTPSTTGLSTRW
ncbi:LLM class flavin-dependent oxidoreductase [Streptosporangium lutulentum]